MNDAKETFEHWSILELMGHVRLAGRVTEEERFGQKLGRIDIPGPDGTWTTQYFGGSSIYRMTPTTEAIARSVAMRSQPAPVHSWELPQALPKPTFDDAQESQIAATFERRQRQEDDFDDEDDSAIDLD
jgi:hypothetical protein